MVGPRRRCSVPRNLLEGPLRVSVTDVAVPSRDQLVAVAVKVQRSPIGTVHDIICIRVRRNLKNRRNHAQKAKQETKLAEITSACPAYPARSVEQRE